MKSYNLSDSRPDLTAGETSLGNLAKMSLNNNMDVDTSDSNDSHGSSDSDTVISGAPCQAVPDIDQDQDWMTNCTEETVSFFSALEQSGVSTDAVEKLQMYGCFFLYCGVVTITLPFIMLVLPETKDLSLSQINFMFRNSEEERRPLCDNK